MQILIAGGSGQIGTLLSRAFAADGHGVTILSRKPRTLDGTSAIEWAVWDGESSTQIADEIDRADVVINLAGQSVNCRYNALNREVILSSRVNSTRAIGHAIADAANPPFVWLQASTATIYSHRYDVPNDDVTGIIGGDEPNAPDTWRFSIDVAKRWEREACEIETPNTRKVLMRSAMTMSPDPGGVFDVMMGLVKRGLGGRQGDGKQWVSWIHEQDFIRAIYWLIDHELAGPVNLCSPDPLPNSEFMRLLRQAAGVRYGLAAPAWLLEIGAIGLRTETELVLKSRRVIPTRLLRSGFEFQFADWGTACVDLCGRRAQRLE